MREREAERETQTLTDLPYQAGTVHAYTLSKRNTGLAQVTSQVESSSQGILTGII